MFSRWDRFKNLRWLIFFRIFWRQMNVNIFGDCHLFVGWWSIRWCWSGWWTVLLRRRAWRLSRLLTFTDFTVLLCFCTYRNCLMEAVDRNYPLAVAVLRMVLEATRCDLVVVQVTQLQTQRPPTKSDRNNVKKLNLLTAFDWIIVRFSENYGTIIGMNF